MYCDNHSLYLSVYQQISSLTNAHTHTHTTISNKCVLCMLLLQGYTHTHTHMLSLPAEYWFELQPIKQQETVRVSHTGMERPELKILSFTIQCALFLPIAGSLLLGSPNVTWRGSTAEWTTAHSLLSCGTYGNLPAC